jgi:hypothetical protein
MKGLLFFLVLLGIAFVAWAVTSKDGFQDMPPGPGLNIPLISPRYQTLTKGEVQPFAPPSTALLAPPPGQSASVNTQPAEDPAMQKATSGRIQSVFESLMGFFKTDAAGLQKIGDPSIQLPLSTARSDRTRLKDELDVLARNPGLESTLTGDDVDGIESNLGYLQKKWRMSVNAMSGNPMEGFTVEGFQVYSCPTLSPNGFAYTLASTMCIEQCPSTGYTIIPGTPRTCRNIFTNQSYNLRDVAATMASPGGGTGTGTGTGATTTTTTTTTTPTPTPKTSCKSDLKLKDVEDLSLKINIEVIRLQRTGTTDLNIQSRINVLSSIRKTMDGIITDVRAGIRKECDIPLMQTDVDKFLPAMANPNSAIPDLIKDTGSNKFLNSLFPKFGVGDISGSVIAQQMFDAYGKDFFNNLSWDVSLSYKGQAEKDIAANYAKAAEDNKIAASDGSPAGPAPAPGSSGAYRGLLDSVVQSASGMSPSHSGAGMGGVPATAAMHTSGEPANFDWKERSKQICGQIGARGYEPNDFGCLADPDNMRQESFSWRGHARMICNRLNTIYDTSVPFLCGCPPPTWPGWRQ